MDPSSSNRHFSPMGVIRQYGNQLSDENIQEIAEYHTDFFNKLAEEIKDQYGTTQEVCEKILERLCKAFAENSKLLEKITEIYKTNSTNSHVVASSS